MLWACVHSPPPSKKKNLRPNTCYPMCNLHRLEMIIIQRAWNLGRISFRLVITQQPHDEWLKELLENGLSIALNVSRLLDVPSIPDRTVKLKHIYVGPSAVSWFSAFLVHFLFVQLLSIQNHSCAMWHITLVWVMHAKGRAELVKWW